jgi:hypothetical protein
VRPVEQLADLCDPPLGQRRLVIVDDRTGQTPRLQ